MVDERYIFMAKNPKIAIIILTKDALEMTKEQLLNVAKLDTHGLDVTCLIVDNGSMDGTKEELKTYKLPNMNYKFIYNNSNLGFAGGNNVGIKYALQNKFDYIILMNNDLILPSDLVTKLVLFMSKNKKVGLASPKMYFANGYEFHKDRYSKEELGKVIWYAGGIIDWDNIYSSHRGVDEVDRGQYDQVDNTEVANGACLIIRSEVFDKIGLLDGSLFLYWEDADFSLRAKRFGYEVKYFPDTCLWHKVSMSAGGSGGFTNDYFLTRNRLYFAMRYAKVRTKIAVLKDTMKLAIYGREWQKIGARDALLGKKGIGSWARK